MGYIIIQLDDNTEARTSTTKLLNKKCDFDLSSDGARLKLVLFNSISCTATEKYYHSFVGEIARGRWDISIEKRYLWGIYFISDAI